jgi:hypothetical protein
MNVLALQRYYYFILFTGSLKKGYATLSVFSSRLGSYKYTKKASKKINFFFL